MHVSTGTALLMELFHRSSGSLDPDNVRRQKSVANGQGKRAASYCGAAAGRV
jgi:hypothetical protein